MSSGRGGSRGGRDSGSTGTGVGRLSETLLARCGLKIPGLATYKIVPEQDNPFTYPDRPFYIQRTDFLITAVLGAENSKRFEGVALNLWFQVFYLLLIVFEGVASYGVTDLLPDEWAAATLVALPFRLGTFGLLKKELLLLLFKETEFRILVVCWVLATFGLLDMFNYDIRSAWVINFSVFVLSNMLQDATAKYSKSNRRFQVYIVCLTLSILNYLVIFSLFYLGFVSNLRFWVLPVEVPTPFEVPVLGNDGNSTFLFVQEIQSVNTSLAIVQILLLYLLKVPYHLLQNNLGIIKVKVFESRESLRRARSIAVAKARKIGSAASRQGSLNDIDASQETLDALEGELGILGGPRLEDTRPAREAPEYGDDLWQVLPSQPHFVVPNQPFTIREVDNVAGALLGENYAEFTVWLFLYEPCCQMLLHLATLFILPGYWLVLIGVLDKNFCYIGFLTGYYMILQLLCGNAKVSLLLIKQTELQLFALLLLFGSIGFGLSFSGDIRTFGMIILNFANLAINAFADARIRIKPIAVLLTMFYFYLLYLVILISFYLGWVVDLTDYSVDLGEAIGLEPSRIVISTVGFSLYCLEFALIFGLKYFWTSYVNKGYAILKVGLKYVQVRTPEDSGSFWAHGASRFFADDDDDTVEESSCCSRLGQRVSSAC